MDSDTQASLWETKGVSSTALIQDRMIDEDDHAGDMSVDPSLLSLRQHPAEFGVEFGSAGEVLGTERVRPPIPRRSVEDTQSEAVVSAIKALQDKIRRLEMERTRAADRFKQLEHDVEEYQSKSHHRHLSHQQQETTLERDKEVVEDQLHAAESRCQLLEKQLDYMRKMVHNAESDRNQALERTRLLEQQSARQQKKSVGIDQDKLDGLERQHVKLSASQALTESRIRDLEGKLEEERHKRKLLQDYAAKLQTDAKTARILTSASCSRDKQHRTRTKSKSKKERSHKISKSASKVVTVKTDVQTKCHHIGSPGVPFVVGTSTTPSHSVSGNIQQALALMKHYNPAIRSRVSVEQPDLDRKHPSVRSQRKPIQVTASELSVVIADLTDEFGALQHEYNELARKIQDHDDSDSSHSRLDHLQQCMDDVVSRMESKSHSIQLLKQHKQQLRRQTKNQWQEEEVEDQRSKSLKRTVTLDGPGEVRVVTTVKSDNDKMDPRVANPKRNLQILKGMKTLQSQLQRDDLSWD